MRKRLDVDVGGRTVPMEVIIVDEKRYPDNAFGLAEDQPGVWSVQMYCSTIEGGQTKEVYTGRYIQLPSPKFRGTEADVRQQFKVLAESTTDDGKKLLIVEKKPERHRRRKRTGRIPPHAQTRARR